MTLHSASMKTNGGLVTIANLRGNQHQIVKDGYMRVKHM